MMKTFRQKFQESNINPGDKFLKLPEFKAFSHLKNHDHNNPGF